VLIMLSANDSVDLVQHARALGANAYVVKPFNLPELLEFIRDFDRQTITADTAMQRF